MSIICSNWKEKTTNREQKLPNSKIRSRPLTSRQNKQRKPLSNKSGKPSSNSTANWPNFSDKNPNFNCKSSKIKKAIAHNRAPPHPLILNSTWNTKDSKNNTKYFRPRWAHVILNLLNSRRELSSWKKGLRERKRSCRNCIATWMSPIWSWTKCDKTLTPRPPILATTKNPSPSTSCSIAYSLAKSSKTNIKRNTFYPTPSKSASTEKSQKPNFSTNTTP